MTYPFNRRYLNLTASNSSYNENTGYYEVDLPIELVRSTSEYKSIIVLGVFYYGNINGLDPDDWVSLHSPTLTNGNPSYINDYITLGQYPAVNWMKEYKIITNDQKLIFEFRHLNKNFAKQSTAQALTEQFVLEFELRW